MDNDSIDWQSYFAEAQTIHAYYFLNHAETFPEANSQHYQVLSTDHPNLLSAITQASTIKAWVIVQRFTWAVGRPYGGYLSTYGYWKELIDLIQSAVIASDQLHEPLAAAGFMTDLGTLMLWQGRLSEAEQHYKSALGVMRSGPAGRATDLAIAGIYQHLGTLSRSRAQFSQARSYLQKALRLAKTWESNSSIANTLQELGNLANDQGDRTEALNYYQQSLALNLALPDPVNAAANKRNIANILYQLGKPDQSESYWQEALAVFVEYNDKRNIAGILTTLAQLALDRYEFKKSRHLCTESITIKQELGFQSALPETIGLLGIITYAEGDATEAAQLFRQAISLSETGGDPKQTNRQRFNLAMLYELTKQFTKAEQLLHQVIAVDQQFNLPDLAKDKEALQRIQQKLAQ